MTKWWRVLTDLSFLPPDPSVGAESSSDLPAGSSSPLSETPHRLQTGNTPTPLRVVTPPFSNTTCTRVHLICPSQDNLCSAVQCPVDLCTSSGSIEEELTRMFVVTGSGDGEESVSLLQCQQLADELTQVARRAVHLHQQVNFLSDWPWL